MARRAASRCASDMPSSSHSRWLAWPTAHATHQPAIRSNRASRSAELSCLESRILYTRRSAGSTAAPSVSGPAQEPRPTSSIPTTTWCPCSPQRPLDRQPGRRALQRRSELRDDGRGHGRPTLSRGSGPADRPPAHRHALVLPYAAAHGHRRTPLLEPLPVYLVKQPPPSGVPAALAGSPSIDSERSLAVQGQHAVDPVARRRSLCIASAGSLLSIGSAGSILSIGSAGSILSIGSAGSILSVESAGSILSYKSAGSILSVRSAGSILATDGLGAIGVGERRRRASGPSGRASCPRLATMLARRRDWSPRRSIADPRLIRISAARRRGRRPRPDRSP